MKDWWARCADVLLKLVQQRGFEMFVHPIAPVLNETRHVVAPFNHKLKQQVSNLTHTLTWFQAVISQSLPHDKDLLCCL